MDEKEAEARPLMGTIFLVNDIPVDYPRAQASSVMYIIGSVRMYNIMCVQKKIVTERTRDLIYLKFVAIDFFPKIISPSAGENSGDLA